MADAHTLLTNQFLAWVAERPRDHADLAQAWRSSCPRLAIWEDALADALVTLVPEPPNRSRVALTVAGAARLRGSAKPVTAIGTASAEPASPP